MRRPIQLALLLLAVLGCRSEPPGGMSREKFVRVNVALRLVADSAPDAKARRTAILRRERVTAAQLERWVRANTPSPVLGEAWREIAVKVDSAEARRLRGSRRPGSRPTPPPDSAGEGGPSVSPQELQDILRERQNKPPPPADDT